MAKKHRPVQRWGEYRRYNDHTWARFEFLEAIQHVAPEVLVALREEVLPAFLPIRPKTIVEIRRAIRGSFEEFCNPIRPHIIRWAERFNMQGFKRKRPPPGTGAPFVVWLEDPVVYTLMKWAHNKNADRSKWYFPGRFSFGAHMDDWFLKPFRYKTKGWSSLLENEAAFKNRVESEFKTKLATYLQERHLSESERLSVKIDTRLSKDYFEWLVKFQVQRISMYRIAKTTAGHKSSRHVSDGIKRAAKAVIGDYFENWLMPPLARGGPGKRRPSSRDDRMPESAE